MCLLGHWQIANFLDFVVEKYQWATIQCIIIKWKVNVRFWSFVRINLGVSIKCKIHISYQRMLQKLEKSRIKWCLSLIFSSRQIPAHPIRNFRSNQSTPGRFDNIGGVTLELSLTRQAVELSLFLCVFCLPWVVKTFFVLALVWLFRKCSKIPLCLIA